MTQTKIDGTKHKYRISSAVDEDTYKQVRYLASKSSLPINEWLCEAIEFYIKSQNKNYELPVLEVQRFNQLIDSIGVLSSNVNSLEKAFVSDFDCLIPLIKGDNYLLNADNDELD